MATSLTDSSQSRPAITGLGAILAIIGAAGVLRISTMLAFLLPNLAEGKLQVFSHQALFQVMWAVFFISLLITGISLIVSGVRGKRRDLVPGLTLYFLGASLMVNGFLLLMYGYPLYGGIAVIIGALAAWIEWSTEVV